MIGDAGYSFVKVAAGTLKDGYYQLQNNHTSKYLTSTKTSNKNRLNLEANGQNHVWYIKTVSGGYTVQYGGPDGQYLTFSHEKASMSNTAQTIQFLNTNGYWGIGATSGNPAPFLAREGTSNSSTSVHGYASNDYKYPGDVGMDWNLYERVENQTTYSISTSDVHHYLGQNDNQVQLTYALLANNTAANLPAGGSYSFQVSQDTNGIISGITNNGLITFNNVAGSCYVKITCTWSEGSVYKYVKVTTERDPNACDHVYTAEVTVPTCTEAGYTTYTCHCGDTYVTDEVAALGHSYESVTVNATCTEAGYTTYTCATCGHSYVADQVVALGHNYESVTVDATCTKDGSITYTCHCSDTYTEVIKAAGHDYKAVVTAPTCTEAGYTTYTCVCGDTYVANEVAANGHKYETVTVAPTCTVDGSATYICACGETYTEVIKADGHNYASVVTAPTCTKAGYTTYTCSCGDSYTADEVAALGHDHKAVVTAPTCTKAGYTTYTCACGNSYVADEVAATGHDYKAVVTAPTCTKAGYTTYTCSCGNSYTADEVAAQGHIYDAVVTEPTSNKGGYTTYTCVCGDSYIGDETEALENSIVAGGTAYEEKTVYVRVDSFENNGKYILIGEDNVSGGNPIAYLNNSGSEGWEIVSVNSGSVTANGTTYSKGYIELDNAKAVWTASGNASNGFTLSNSGRYIGGTDANTLKSSSSDAVKVIYDASAVRLKTASGTTRYLYYSTYGSENWKWATSINSSSSSRKMWIYKEVTVQIPVSAPATYTLDAADVQHILTDYSVQLQYTLLADGAAAELPSGGRYSFQVSKDTNGIIADISDKGLITFNNVAGTCYVKITCTWNDGSVYKYVKVTTELDPNACDHVYTAEVTAPTCTEAGYTTYTCHCGDTYVADEIAAKGHTYKSVTVNATCAAEGSVTYTCACGDTYVEVIKMTNHSYASVVTAPTCTKEGYTTHTCASCGYCYVDSNVAAPGHSYSCVESNGYLVYTCNACGDSYSEKAVTYSQVSSISSGNQYVLTVFTGNKYYALSHANNTLSAVEISVSNGEITSEVTEDLLWNCKDSKLSYEKDGTTYYLYGKKAGPKDGTVSISTSSSSITFKSNKLKIGTQYLRYADNKLTLNSSATTAYVFAQK